MGHYRRALKRAEAQMREAGEDGAEPLPSGPGLGEDAGRPLHVKQHPNTLSMRLPVKFRMLPMLQVVQVLLVRWA